MKTLLQNLKIFWDGVFEFWYAILLTVALVAVIIWLTKKLKLHRVLPQALVRMIKWFYLQKILPVRILIALLVGAIITGVGIVLTFGVKFKGVKLSPTDSIISVIFLGVAVIVMIPLVVIASYLIRWALTKSKATKVKTAKTGGLKLPVFASSIVNGLWAIAGLLFAYWLLSQIWPAFWNKWSGSAGFWWLPVALVAGFWLIGKKGGQAPTVAAFIIGIAILAVTITSCRSIMWAVQKEKVAVQTQTTVFPKSVTERQWVYDYSKPPWVKGLQPGIRGETKPAKIIYFDEMRFDFKTVLLNGTESPYQGIGYKDGSEFVWKGNWSQVNPDNSGEWYLKPVQFDGRIPTRFEGSKTTRTGESYNIWLRAVD